MDKKDAGVEKIVVIRGEYPATGYGQRPTPYAKIEAIGNDGKSVMLKGVTPEGLQQLREAGLISQDIPIFDVRN